MPNGLSRHGTPIWIQLGRDIFARGCRMRRVDEREEEDLFTTRDSNYSTRVNLLYCPKMQSLTKITVFSQSRMVNKDKQYTATSTEVKKWNNEELM